MPNHVHLVVVPRTAESLAAAMIGPRPRRVETARARSMEKCNGRFRSNRARRRSFVSLFVLATARAAEA